MESRQCTPSVLARLMGLDELSPHQPLHKKQKVLSENYLRRVNSVAERGKRSSHERHSFRLVAEEKKEIKDTLHGKLKREEQCNLPVEKGKFSLSLSDAKEVGDAQGVVDSKIDLFMKYLKEPDSLITDRLCNLHGIPYHLQPRHLTVLKSSNASDTGMTDICSISRGETDQGSAKLLRELETGRVTCACGEHVPGNGYKFLKSQKESDTLPTRIVVLKPNHGKKENAARYFPPRSSCRDCHSISRKHKEFPSPEKGTLYIEEKERKNVTEDVEPVRLRFGICGKISGQTEQGKNNLFMKVSKPGSRDNDTFVKETELKTFTSLNFCDWKNHQKPLLYHSDRSYVDREARKDILEGFGTTKKFQEVEAASGSRTLGEMIESNSGKLDFRLGERAHSSQDGLRSNLFMRPLESANRLRHRFRKQSHNQKEGSEHGCKIHEGRDVQEQKKLLVEKDLSEQSSVVTKSSVDSVVTANMIDDMVTDAATVVEGRSSETVVEDGHFSSQVPHASTLQDISIGIFKEDAGSSFCSCIDPESLVNSEEAYQFSPNSVFEPPFEEETLSNSACVQNVDANLHDLLLQLELLRSESSETCSEGDGMNVSSDDDFERGSVNNAVKSELFMRPFSIEAGRDFSYLVDVFTEAGFHVRNSGMSYDTWDSPECPISAAVFEMLEKKYGEHISWKRSERRLLFDRINSELMGILQPSMGCHWTKPLSTRICFGKSLDTIEENLWTLLDYKKKQANKDSSGKMMGKDDGWLELGDSIEVIVREIEDALVDQLATEVVSMESF